MLGYIISNKEKINVKEHKIKSFDILRKTNLNIFVVKNNKVLYINNIVYNASVYGHVEVLNWFKNSGYEFKYDVLAINMASNNGHVQVLKWFKNSGYKFKYNEYAINWASMNGHVRVLEWFKNSGYELKYDEYAIRYLDNKKTTLNWFIKNRNVKKVIKWSESLNFNKTIKFKTKNNYIKGYNKN